jgi:hypothetical protein
MTLYSQQWNVTMILRAVEMENFDILMSGSDTCIYVSDYGGCSSDSESYRMFRMPDKGHDSSSSIPFCSQEHHI